MLDSLWQFFNIFNTLFFLSLKASTSFRDVTPMAAVFTRDLVNYTSLKVIAWPEFRALVKTALKH